MKKDPGPEAIPEVIPEAPDPNAEIKAEQVARAMAFSESSVREAVIANIGAGVYLRPGADLEADLRDLGRREGR